MIPIPALLALKSFITPKRIAIAIGAIAIGLVLWNIYTTYQENDKLTAQVATQQVTIKSLADTVKTKENIITEMQQRVKDIDASDTKREEVVAKEVTKTVVFKKKSESKVNDIKQNNPDQLPKHYESEYNEILDCITDVTAKKESSC